MHDVEEQIEQWRASLAGSELLRGEDAAELESHLREEMGHLRTSGLSDNEAFFVARSRLGDTEALEEEFAKVNAPRRLRNRLCWMIAGVLAYWVAVHFAGAASGIALAIAQATGGSPYVLGLIASGVQIVGFCAMALVIVWFCGRYFQPGSPSRIQITTRVRIAFLAALLMETVGFALTRALGVVCVARTMPVTDFGQIARVESYVDLVWRLAGPVLLGVLLVVIHLAGRRPSPQPGGSL
jgi:hypothetical protein